MAFLDDLKRNAKTAADATKKKTSELTAIAKATMQMKSEESKMTICYQEIGRLFYEAERDGNDNADEIATYIMQIDKSKAAVAGLKKEIAVLKNVMVCENCNNEISNSCIFCPICGTKIPKEEPAEECCCTDECCCADDCCCDDECCCDEECCCEEKCCCEEDTSAAEEAAE